MDFADAFFDPKDFEVTDVCLGKGSYGQVFVAMKKGKKYAIKIIDTTKGFNWHDQMLFVRESQILSKLNHPLIVKFYGINLTSFENDSVLRPSIITEFLPNGSLRSVLDKEEKSIADHAWTPSKKYISLLGVASAMRYLHARGILHRDLKPDNILLDADFCPHICDFGLSKCFANALSNSMQLTMTGKVGTPVYMAPELLSEDYDDQGHFSPSIDVYSFGIIAYEIVTGVEPYSELGKISFYKLISKVIAGYRPVIPEKTPEQMKDLILKCLSNNPKARPSFEDIFSELSDNFDNFSEDVDEDEVRNFLEKIKTLENDQGTKKKPQKKDDFDDAESYFDIINSFAENVESLDEIDFSGILKKILFYGTILHKLCKLGNLDLVEHIISLNKMDIHLKDVYKLGFI